MSSFLEEIKHSYNVGLKKSSKEKEKAVKLVFNKIISDINFSLRECPQDSIKLNIITYGLYPGLSSSEFIEKVIPLLEKEGLTVEILESEKSTEIKVSGWT